LLYDPDRATSSTLNRKGIEFLNHACGIGWKKMGERSSPLASSKEERKRYYREHVTNDLVRADINSQVSSPSGQGRTGGWLSVDDVRRAGGT
jgi:hypothetical protein